MKRRFAIGNSSAVILSLLCGCSSMQPTIKSVTPRISHIGFDAVTLAFDIEVYNPLPMKLRVPAYRYAVDIADSPFFSSDSDAPLELPSVGTGTVMLPARIGYADLWNTFRNLADETEVAYRLRGALPIDLPTGMVELPFSYEGTLPVLKVPHISVTKVETPGISLTGAEVAIEGQIVNPNVFALGISKLGYMLRLGEIDVGHVEVNTDDSVAAGATGVLTLRCRLDAKSAAKSVLGGGKIGAAKLVARGEIDTPYGSVSLSGE